MDLTSAAESGWAWADVGSDGSVDVIVQRERLLVRSKEEGSAGWVFVPTDSAAPLTVFLALTEMGVVARMLLPEADGPIAIWDWVQAKVDQGEKSPISGGETQYRSISWTADEEKRLVSIETDNVAPRPGYALATTIRALEEVERPPSDLGDARSLAGELALPYLLSSDLLNPDCELGVDPGSVRQCVEGLAGSKTVDEWMEERGVHNILPIAECG